MYEEEPEAHEEDGDGDGDGLLGGYKLEKSKKLRLSAARTCEPQRKTYETIGSRTTNGSLDGYLGRRLR